MLLCCILSAQSMLNRFDMLHARKVQEFVLFISQSFLKYPRKAFFPFRVTMGSKGLPWDRWGHHGVDGVAMGLMGLPWGCWGQHWAGVVDMGPVGSTWGKIFTKVHDGNLFFLPDFMGES